MAKSKPRTVDEIRADLASNRARMSASFGEFVEEVKPKNVAKRGVEQAKGFVNEEFQAAKAQIKDDSGWRTDRILAIGGAIVGVVVFAVTLRSIANRRTRAIHPAKPRALESKA